VENLIAAGLLAANKFSFFLTRSSLPGSILTLGGINPDHYTGNISYTPVTQRTYWEIEITGVNVESVPATGAISAAVDTGSTFIFVPKAMAEKIVRSTHTFSIPFPLTISILRSTLKYPPPPPIPSITSTRVTPSLTGNTIVPRLLISPLLSGG
jgi:hypothetical protein